MTDEIIDNGQHWPIQDSKVSQQQIRVKMAGQNGFNQVTNGANRPGQAIINGNSYKITLPGLNGGGLEVEFKRTL